MKYLQLDSLRGIAAMMVVLWHYSLQMPQISFVHTSFLSFFCSGDSAVIFFFVLSGFVLTLGLTKINLSKGNYFSYVIKRFFRIYIPYIVSFLVAILLCSILSRHGIIGMGTWFNSIWMEPIGLKTFLGHVFFLGEFNNGAYNPVYWSLVIEMRISLLLPFVIYFYKRIGVYPFIVFSFFVLFLSFGLHLYSEKYLNISSDYFLTGIFLFSFCCGILLADHIDILQARFKEINGLSVVGLFIIGYFLFIVDNLFPSSIFINNYIVKTILVSISSGIFILLSLSSDLVGNFLLNRHLVKLGSISYSVYLYHSIVLLTLVYLLYPQISYIEIALLSMILTFFVSNLGYALELRSMSMGHKIVDYLKI